MRLGYHVSISGSIDKAVDRAREKDCNTFQIFTRNPRGWGYKELSDEEIREFIRKTEEYHMDPPVAHVPYLPNLASSKEEIYERSVQSLIHELERCGKLKIPYLVTHLGSHLGAGVEAGLKNVVKACDRALSKVRNDVMILLEVTAGQRNSVGHEFEHIRYIIDHTQDKKRLGVCFDTCHSFAAGYDLRNRRAVDETMKKFDEVIGFDLLKVVHISDAKGPLGARLDRHEHVGLGYIGEEGFKAILSHSVLRRMPLILETPVDKRGDFDRNLRKVRELYG